MLWPPSGAQSTLKQSRPLQPCFPDFDMGKKREPGLAPPMTLSFYVLGGSIDLTIRSLDVEPLRLYKQPIS